MKAIHAIILAVTAFAAGYFAAPRRAPRAETRFITHTDTLVTRDTVRVTISPPALSRPSERIVTIHDTILVPATQRVYADTLYRAVVSGVDPRLDSLTIFPERVTITRRPSPWGVGITAGVALTPRGLTPALTLGVTYSFSVSR